MSKYKIEIESAANGYIATLEKREWGMLWMWYYWNIVEIDVSELPYSDKVIEWQRKYNIPDKKVILLFVKH